MNMRGMIMNFSIYIYIYIYMIVEFVGGEKKNNSSSHMQTTLVMFGCWKYQGKKKILKKLFSRI